MIRWLESGLAAGLLAAFAGLSAFNGISFGADKSLPSYERRLLARHGELAKKKLSERLRLERAQLIARQRLANSGYGAPPAQATVPFGYRTSTYRTAPRSFYWSVETPEKR